jgi:phosphoenolpyruvate carboxylase
LRCLEAVTGTNERLAGNPLLARSIQNRFAYLDPLNHLQVELIHRRRKLGDNGYPRVHRGIHLPIIGVAAGRRNTGGPTRRFFLGGRVSRPRGCWTVLPIAGPFIR